MNDLHDLICFAFQHTVYVIIKAVSLKT